MWCWGQFLWLFLPSCSSVAVLGVPSDLTHPLWISGSLERPKNAVAVAAGRKFWFDSFRLLFSNKLGIPWHREARNLFIDVNQVFFENELAKERSIKKKKSYAAFQFQKTWSIDRSKQHVCEKLKIVKSDKFDLEACFRGRFKITLRLTGYWLKLWRDVDAGRNTPKVKMELQSTGM